MLEIAEITNPTGNAYMPGSRITALSTDRIIELDYYQIISDETGEKSKSVTREQSDYTRDLFPYRLLAETTGADIYECREFLGILGTDVVSHNSITNTSFIIKQTISIQKESPKLLPFHLLQESTFSQEIADLAASLRQFSGLDVGSIAQIFKVSRATYHRWLRGLPVNKRHRDYILETLPLLEEAAHRLGSPEAVSTWLLTPISSGGKKPIEYLAEKEYNLFRGFLLHQPTGKEQFRPLKPSRRVFRSRKQEEIEDVREQLRPHTWYEEDNGLNSNND
ncbi:MAG TPA: hypothetical protein VFV38_03235 [Ktedonobacteraceae bacterium]|nr:hypothetical protein [Ktedonobacteraceae bacterium]